MLMWTFSNMFVSKINACGLMMVFIVIGNMFDSTIL